MSQYPNERDTRHGVHHNPGSGTYGESPASGPAPTTAGHHKHDLLNKFDPRVDSTRDRLPLASQNNSNNNNNVSAGTYGLHSSRLANTLDPRVDSDMDHRAAGAGGPPGMRGASGTGTGTGSGASEGTYSPHRSRVANSLDPRYDSDADHRAGHDHFPTAPGYGPGPGPGAGAAAGMGGGTGRHHHQEPVRRGPAAGMNSGGGAYNTGAYDTGAALPGPAPNTAGPHRSDLLNKLDPRVDSKTGERENEQPYTEGKYTERKGI